MLTGECHHWIFMEEMKTLDQRGSQAAETPIQINWIELMRSILFHRHKDAMVTGRNRTGREHVTQKPIVTSQWLLCSVFQLWLLKSDHTLKMSVSVTALSHLSFLFLFFSFLKSTFTFTSFNITVHSIVTIATRASWFEGEKIRSHYGDVGLRSFTSPTNLIVGFPLSDLPLGVRLRFSL